MKSDTQVYKGVWYYREGCYWKIKGMPLTFDSKDLCLKHIDFIKEPDEKLKYALKSLNRTRRY